MRSNPRNLALADVTDDDLDAFLKEDETLFVEHKGNLAADAMNVAKAMGSFANGLGGWILIGVSGGNLTSGTAGGWVPPPRGQFVDHVRWRLRAASIRCRPLPPRSSGTPGSGEPRGLPWLCEPVR